MQAHFLKRYQCCKGIITALSQIDFELIHINGWNLLVQYTWSIVTAQANNTLKAKRNLQHESRGGCQVICPYQAYPGSKRVLFFRRDKSAAKTQCRATRRGEGMIFRLSYLTASRRGEIKASGTQGIPGRTNVYFAVAHYCSTRA